MWLRNFFQSTDDRLWKRRIQSTIVIGIGIRLLVAFVVLPVMPQMGDGPSYVRQAHQILLGTIDRFYFPPGTALFSAPIFSVLGFSTTSEHLVGVAISVLFLVATTWLARSILADHRAVFIATLIAALYPHVVLSAAQISSLPLTAAMLSLAVGAMSRANRDESVWWSLASGAFCGAAVVIRPGTILLPVVLCGWLLLGMYRRKSSTSAAMQLIVVHWAVIVALCLPVLQFHSYRGHGLVLSTNNEWNFLIANNHYTPDYKTGHFGQRAMHDIDPDAAAYLRQFIHHDSPESASLFDRRRMVDSATTFITEHPVRTVWRVTNRFRGFWGLDYTAARELQLNYGYSDVVFGLVLLFEGGGYLVVLFLWLIWLVRDNGVSSISRWWHVALSLAIMVPHLVAFSLAKYHLPVIPLMCCSAALVIQRYFCHDGLLRELSERRYLLIILVIAVLLIQVEHLIHLIILR